MQQNLQRMSNQLQAMQQEVRDLTQLTQQLAHQGMQQFQHLQQQMHDQGGQSYGQAPSPSAHPTQDQYLLVRNEQASLQLLQNLTEVCQEMNQHLKNISQQMNNNRTATNNMTFQPMNSKFGAAQNMQNMQSTQNQNTQSVENSTATPTEADLQGNLNEYREDPQTSQYPYNRYTT